MTLLKYIKMENNLILDIKNSNYQEGKLIYKENEFMRDLYDMMSNERFRIFVDKYLNEWNSIKSVIMFIKLFETIEYEYFQKFNETISKELMLVTLKKLFEDRDLRKLILKSYDDFQNAKNSTNSKYLSLT